MAIWCLLHYPLPGASLKMKCWQICLLLNSSVFVYLTHWSFRVCIDKQLSLKSDIYTGTFNLYDTNWPIPFTKHNRTKWICATALIAISLLDTSQKLYERLLSFDDNENFVFLLSPLNRISMEILFVCFLYCPFCLRAFPFFSYSSNNSSANTLSYKNQ